MYNNTDIVHSCQISQSTITQNINTEALFNFRIVNYQTEIYVSAVYQTPVMSLFVDTCHISIYIPMYDVVYVSITLSSIII